MWLLMRAARAAPEIPRRAAFRNHERRDGWGSWGEPCHEAEYLPRGSEQDQRHAGLIRQCATERKPGLGAIAGLSA
jgi:hypothetical protein